MHKLLFILIGLIFLNNTQAQKIYQPCGYAFSILIEPGTLPVDENGVPMKRKIKKERFIYIVLSGKEKPSIKTISYNNIAVKWDVLNIAEKEYAAVNETTQKTMSIKPLKNGSMWRINIQEIDHRFIGTKAVPIIIKGDNGTKAFETIIGKETAVQGYETY